jgi:DNA polymerase
VFVFPLFHPAAALRTPSVLERLRGDFAKLPDLLKESLPESESADNPDDPSAEERRPPDSQLDLFAG